MVLINEFEQKCKLKLRTIYTLVLGFLSGYRAYRQLQCIGLFFFWVVRWICTGKSIDCCVFMSPNGPPKVNRNGRGSGYICILYNKSYFTRSWKSRTCSAGTLSNKWVDHYNPHHHMTSFFSTISLNTCISYCITMYIIIFIEIKWRSINL